MLSLPGLTYSSWAEAAEPASFSPSLRQLHTPNTLILPGLEPKTTGEHLPVACQEGASRQTLWCVAVGRRRSRLPLPAQEGELPEVKGKWEVGEELASSWGSGTPCHLHGMAFSVWAGRRQAAWTSLMVVPAQTSMRLMYRHMPDSCLLYKTGCLETAGLGRACLPRRCAACCCCNPRLDIFSLTPDRQGACLG